MQVFRGTEIVQLHAITLTADSLTGIPFHRLTSCDTCRISYPLASIDSVRAGDPVGGFFKTIALIGAINLTLLFILFGGIPTGEGT